MGEKKIPGTDRHGMEGLREIKAAKLIQPSVSSIDFHLLLQTLQNPEPGRQRVFVAARE